MVVQIGFCCCCCIILLLGKRILFFFHRFVLAVAFVYIFRNLCKCCSDISRTVFKFYYYVFHFTLYLYLNSFSFISPATEVAIICLVLMRQQKKIKSEVGFFMLFSKKKHALNFILLKIIAKFFFITLCCVYFFLFTFIHFRKIRSIFFVVFVSKKGFLLSFCYSCIKVAEWQSQKKTQKINSYCNFVVAAALCLLLLFSVIFRGLFFLFLGLFGSVWRAPKRALTLNSQLVQQKAKFILKIHTRKIVNERTAQRAYNQMQPTSNIERTK